MRSVRRPHLTILIGVSTTHARFALACLRSPQARGLAHSSAHNLKDTFSTLRVILKGRPPEDRREGGSIHPLLCWPMDSSHSNWAFLRPDLPALSERRPDALFFSFGNRPNPFLPSFYFSGEFLVVIIFRPAGRRTGTGGAIAYLLVRTNWAGTSAGGILIYPASGRI